MRAFLSLAAATLLAVPVFAQQVTRCGTGAPTTLASARRALPALPSPSPSAELFSLPASPYVDTNQIITLPLVIHVVTDGSVAQQVDMAQINSQLTVLNQDFLRSSLANPPLCGIPAFDALAADVRFQFCLAQVDYKTVAPGPQFVVDESNPTYSPMTDLMIAAPPIDQRRFINVWVCNLNKGGVATFPSFSPGVHPLTAFDGVAVKLGDFGTTGTAQAPWNKGHVLTHELGHYFGLYHLWGTNIPPHGTCASDDYVSDTPEQTNPTLGFVAAGTRRYDTCTPGGDGLMWMNYMDYTDDLSLTMFSLGQKKVMREALFTNPNRSSLLGSNNTCPVALTCLPDPYETTGGGASNDVKAQASPAAWNQAYWPILCAQDNDWFVLSTPAGTPGGTITLADPWVPYFTNTTNEGVYRFDVYKNNVLVAANLAAYTVTPIAGQAATYHVRVYSDNYHPFLPYQLVLAQACAQPDEAAGSPMPALPSTAVGRLCGYQDDDDWAISVPANSGSLQISLTGLTRNYQLELYDASNPNQPVAVAPQNGANAADKTITFSLPVPLPGGALYRARVFGYQGAFDPTATYTLNAAATPECTPEGLDSQLLTAAAATGQVCPLGDLDNWLVKVPKGQQGIGATTTISAQLTGMTKNYQVNLYAPGPNNTWTLLVTGVPLSPSPGAFDKKVNATVATPAADLNYRLQVLGVANACDAASVYTLKATATPNCVDANEGALGNDVLMNATVVPVADATPLKTLNGQMCPQPTDVDWYKIVATTTRPNVLVTLANIPGGQDFDAELYTQFSLAGGMVLVASGTTLGNTSEVFRYDPCLGTKRTYYLKIIAKNQGYATGNYSLTIQLDGSYFRWCPPIITGLRSLPLHLEASPNPAAEAVDLTLTGAAPQQPALVTLLDQLGREVLRQEMPLAADGTTLHLGLSRVPAGLYQVRVSVAGSTATTKLQVLH